MRFLDDSIQQVDTDDPSQVVEQPDRDDAQQVDEQDDTVDAQQVDEQVLRLGSAPVGRLLFEFGVPSVIAVVCNAFYNVIDSVFLGQAMGKIGLAATTVATPLMTFMIAICVIAGAGGNALAAILLGEGDHDQAEKTLGNTMLLIILLAIPVAFVATFCLDPLLVLVGATDETLPYARLFMQIIAYGFILNNIAFGILNFMRTAGAPWQALGVSILGTVVCIALNYLFVLVWGWGVFGSALATVLGQAAASVWVLWYFIFNSKAPFHLRARYLKPDWKLCAKILSLGLAPFALQAAAAVTQIAGNSVMATLGAADVLGQDAALASVGVMMKIVMFSVFPAVGIATAAQPILGFNVGARKYSRVKRTLYEAILAAFVILLCFFIVIHVWPRQLIGLFGVSEDLMDFSVEALQIMTIIMPLACLQMIGSNYFQATGQPSKSTILSLTRQIIFLLPAYFICPAVLPTIFEGMRPLIAFAFAFPVADFLAVATCSIFLIAEIRRLNRLIREKKEG